MRFMGIGEAAAPEIRHRVHLAPHHVVQDPVAQVLQDRAYAENIVVGLPITHKAPLGLRMRRHSDEPCLGEIVIAGKVRELVPVVINCIDLALVGARQVAIELQVVRRVSEHKVHRCPRGSSSVARDAVANQDLVQSAACTSCFTLPDRHNPFHYTPTQITIPDSECYESSADSRVNRIVLVWLIRSPLCR